MVKTQHPETEKFRTHDQMSDVYARLAEQNREKLPYVLEYETNGQELIFFGAVHSANPEHEQVKMLDNKWRQFINSPNSKKHALSEGNLRPVEGKSKEGAIRNDAESGHICWLAHKSKVPIISPEPDRKEEIDHLHAKGFSYEKIITYYFARQMLQWANYDHLNTPNWSEYAEQIGLYKSVHDFGGLELNLESMLDIFAKETGKQFDTGDKRMLYNLSDPGQSPVSSASGKFRDEKLYQTISGKWREGYSVFVVYGSGHAIVLEPALERLVELT